MKKPVRCGLGYITDINGNDIKVSTLKQVQTLGKKCMEPRLKVYGFETFVSEHDDNFTINYGKR